MDIDKIKKHKEDAIFILTDSTDLEAQRFYEGKIIAIDYCLPLLESLQQKIESLEKELAECKEFANSRIKLTNDLTKQLNTEVELNTQLKERVKELEDGIENIGSYNEQYLGMDNYELLKEILHVKQLLNQQQK